MKGITRAAILAGTLVGSFLVSELLYVVLDRKKPEGWADNPPCPVYEEDQPEGEGCRPVYHDFRDGVSYYVERERNPPKTHIYIQGDIHARDSNGGIYPTLYIVSHARNDPAVNQFFGLSPLEDSSRICHTEYMPMPPTAVTLPKPDGTGLQPYLSAIDADCDDTVESVRFWFRYQEGGRTGYRPYPLPRAGADPLVLPLFEAVDAQLRGLRNRLHVSDIEAIVAREHQAI